VQFLKIRADPTAHYDRPDDVLSDDRFEVAQKLEILRQWGRDLQKRDPNPSAYGRAGTDTTAGQIARAVEALGSDPDEILKRRTN